LFLLVVFAQIGYVQVAKSSWYLAHKFGFVSPIQNERVDRIEKAAPNVFERLRYWEFYATSILSKSKVFFLGHATPPDRKEYPSAHNYYSDFVYNFGFLAFLPIFTLMGFTLVMVYRCRQEIWASSSLVGLTAVVLFLLLADNSLKVV